MHVAQSYSKQIFLEIPSLYLNFIPDSLNIPVNSSYEAIPQLLSDPMI